MRIYSGILFLFLISCTNSNEKDNFLLQKGDILFQDLDSSPLCEAIERVTPGYKKANFSHIGIVLELGDPFCINSNISHSFINALVQVILSCAHFCLI